MSVCQSVCLSVRLSVCLSVCQSVCLSVRLSVCQSLNLSICLSVCHVQLWRLKALTYKLYFWCASLGPHLGQGHCFKVTGANKRVSVSYRGWPAFNWKAVLLLDNNKTHTYHVWSDCISYSMSRNVVIAIGRKCFNCMPSFYTEDQTIIQQCIVLVARVTTKTVKPLAHLQQNKITGMRLVKLMQLPINCRIRHCLLMLLSSAVGGDAVITCRKARRDWLQQFRLMNNGIMLMRLQELYKKCASLVGRPVILFYFSAKCQNSCTIFMQEFNLIFYFIANGRTALVRKQEILRGKFASNFPET